VAVAACLECLMTRIFLAAVGAAYIALGLWCTLRPAQTSAAVGYQLQPGSGQSEFVTVYGGLELALGALFLLPLLHRDATGWTLLACLVIHVTLALFRVPTLFLFPGVSRTILAIAVLEVSIALVSAALYWANRPAGEV
jgi:hypothetical protein